MKINILLKNKVIILIFLIFFTIFYSGKIYASSMPGGGGACPCGSHKKCHEQCVLGGCPNGVGTCCLGKQEVCHRECDPCPPSTSDTAKPPGGDYRDDEYCCNTSNYTCYKCKNGYSTRSVCETYCQPPSGDGGTTTTPDTTPPTNCIPCSCPSAQCSPFPPYINSFSIYPNRLFTNQAFNISYQETRKMFVLIQSLALLKANI